MTGVLDRLAELAKAGKISAGMAAEAAATYRGLLASGHAEDAAALKTADFLRGKARARLSAVHAMVDDPSLIPGVAAAMREQWRESQAGRKPN